MTAAPAVVLAAHDLGVRRGRTDILRHLDLELRAGEVTVLLGPNGAGKSTLLAALAGSIPVSGRIERRGRVALALQSPDLARRSVLANVEAATRWWGVARHERRTRARAALEAMDAGHLAGRAARSLSGGETRRVHLARALAVSPDLLLLDEPFAGLDPQTRAGLLDDTGSALRAAAGASLVVVHDRAEAWALADRVLVLIDGRLVADGPPRPLLEQPPSMDVARFLGFTGTLRTGPGRVVLTRPHDVVLDDGAPLRATVTRVVPLEEGVRLDLRTPDGDLQATVPFPGPAPGDEVGVRLTGGAAYATAAADPAVDGHPAAQVEPTVPPTAPHESIP